MSSKPSDSAIGTGPLGLTLVQLEDWCTSRELPRFRAKQIFHQFHQRLLGDFGAASDLPKALREDLQQSFGAIRQLEVVQQREAEDGTRKLALQAADGASFETVLIPMDGPFTQCLSSQSGCAMGCTFCYTGATGVGRNLTAAEILEQHYRGLELCEGNLRNLVFMGMGEPMQNLDEVLAACRLLMDPEGRAMSPTRLTVSTCGVVPGIKRLGREAPGVRLAVSLNAADDETRSKLMPINKRYNLETLKATLKAHPLSPRDRLTFEYIMLAGVNDRQTDARNLLRFLDGLRCKLNLIPFNEVPALPFKSSPMERIHWFQDLLKSKGIPVTIRASKGRDIMAACGQLARTSPR
jgi:23S rRNA (adenine2503-C2)-methyltransferase